MTNIRYEAAPCGSNCLLFLSLMVLSVRPVYVSFSPVLRLVTVALYTTPLAMQSPGSGHCSPPLLNIFKYLSSLVYIIVYTYWCMLLLVYINVYLYWCILLFVYIIGVCYCWFYIIVGANNGGSLDQLHSTIDSSHRSAAPILMFVSYTLLIYPIIYFTHNSYIHIISSYNYRTSQKMCVSLKSVPYHREMFLKIISSQNVVKCLVYPSHIRIIYSSQTSVSHIPLAYLSHICPVYPYNIVVSYIAIIDFCLQKVIQTEQVESISQLKDITHLTE